MKTDCTDAAPARAAKDDNGWFEIKDNPLTKAGVFPYLGHEIMRAMDSDRKLGLDPAKMYKVFRSPKELQDQDTIDSFKLLPWVADHVMLGKGATPVESVGIGGVIGEQVYYEEPYLKGNLKVLSEDFEATIDTFKNGLSLGYRCLFLPEKGEYNGEEYDFVQRKLRGNHMSAVDKGRAGPEVRVMDEAPVSANTIKFYIKEPHEVNEYEENQKEEDLTLMDLAKLVDELKKTVEELKAGEEVEKDVVAEDKMDVDEEIVADEETTEKKDITEDEEMDKDEYRKKDAMDIRPVLVEIAKRDSLAKKLSHKIGVFDHAEKTLLEVATYGLKKLGVSAAEGQELSFLEGYLAARPLAPQVAMDAQPEEISSIDAYLKEINGVN